MDKPDGVIKEVIYPVVGETTLKNLVREFKSTGTAYKEKVYTVMRSSYGNHYRRMLPFLLNLLEFCSNNEIHKPIIEALELLKKYIGSRERYYDESEKVPTELIIYYLGSGIGCGSGVGTGCGIGVGTGCGIGAGTGWGSGVGTG